MQIGIGKCGEFDVELIYARNLRLMTSPGGAVGVSLIWNLTDSGAYTGPFMELPVGYGVTFSSSGVISDAGREEESPQGIKFGIGTPGDAILYEQYMQISGQRRLAVARGVCESSAQKRSWQVPSFYGITPHPR